ncbi:hypothetical protein ACRRTK_014256 [Alexandromys fortis]
MLRRTRPVFLFIPNPPLLFFVFLPPPSLPGRVNRTATHQHPLLQHLGKLLGVQGSTGATGVFWALGSQALPCLV